MSKTWCEIETNSSGVCHKEIQKKNNKGFTEKNKLDNGFINLGILQGDNDYSVVCLFFNPGNIQVI